MASDKLQVSLYLTTVGLVMLAHTSHAIQGGTSVDMCDYPGIAAVVAADTNTVLCSGVTQPGDVLLLPQLCKSAMEKQLEKSDINIRYGNGDNTITITKSSSGGSSSSDSSGSSGGSSSTNPCDMNACSKQIGQASSDSEKCGLTKEWRSCLEGLTAPPCSISSNDFPQALADAESSYCNGASAPAAAPSGPLSGQLSDGVYRVKLPAPLSAPCETPPKIFDRPLEIKPDACEMVGFGADTLASKEFDKSGAKSAPVTKSTSSPCCSVIQSTVKSLVEFVEDDSVTLNCLTSSGSACSVADVGAPIYCDTTSGEKVVIGLTATAPCTPGEVFVAHDLTSGDPSVKFGIAPLP